MVIEKNRRVASFRHLTMGTAESCTGGYIAHLITRVAGSSDYFLWRESFPTAMK